MEIAGIRYSAPPAITVRGRFSNEETALCRLFEFDWFPGRTLEQKRELAEVLTREFARIAKCKPETINFIFTEVSREDWGRNGKLFCDAYEYENDPTS